MPAPNPPSQKTSSAPSVAAVVSDLLDRMARPGTTPAEADRLMARLDGHEVAALLPVFRHFHDATADAELHAATRVLARWIDRPVARALKPALLALLNEPEVGDLNKLAAAGLLETLGEPVDLHRLRRAVADPAAVAHGALRAVLDASADPFAVLRFLDRLADDERELVLAVIHDLMAIGDPRAARILGPLTWSADDEVAQAARAAIAALSDTGPVVGNGGKGNGGKPQGRGSLEDEESTEAYLSSRSEDGGQLVVLARTSAADPARFDVLTLYLTAAAGVREYASAEWLTPDDLAHMLAEMAAGGLTLVEVTTDEAARVVETAAARTRAVGGADAVGWAVWSQVLG